MKKKKNRYHTGIHHSPKCIQEIHYRSGWEDLFAKYLDENVDVISYEYESVIVPYINNVRSGMIRRYYPDFLVTYSNGTKKLIEIKPLRKLNQKQVQKKLAAAQIWCSEHGATLEVITENELRLLGLL